MKMSLLACSISLLLLGCKMVDQTPIPVDIDPELAQHAQSYPIIKADTLWADGQLNVTMGPYKITRANSGWRESTTHAVVDMTLVFDAIERLKYANQQSLTFVFNTPSGQTWQALCKKYSTGTRTDIKLSEERSLSSQDPYFSAYRCGFKNDTGRWELVLDNYEQKGVNAYMQTPNGQRWSIDTFRHSAVPAQNNPFFGFLGFYLSLDNQKVAAVSTLDPGQLWLRNDQTQSVQDAASMAAVGLWFYHNAFIEAVDKLDAATLE